MKLKRPKAAFLIALGFIVSTLLPMRQTPAAAQETENPLPLLAYYYIWFDPGSWERAKTDYPLLGRYSSNDRSVMQQHVRWAKQVGIDGFIVSWKNTDQLSSRLEVLIEVAEEEQFQLAIIYQGLDFERRPQPTDQISSDLTYFLENYADSAAFQIFNRPLVIWSGTWEFSSGEVAQVASTVAEDLYLLASERQNEGYARLSELVDGNAYYWSSVDPEGTPGYQQKLDDMSRLVREGGGLWIAPAAPGYDARLLGGRRIIERADGRTLRLELDAAVRSSPDAIGLISWNEFSENSHIEPSERYGMRYLEVLADVRGGLVPPILDFDSNHPSETLPEINYGRLASFGLLGAIALGSLVLILFRRSGEAS